MCKIGGIETLKQEVKGGRVLMCKYCENKDDMGNKPLIEGYRMKAIIDGEFLYLYCECGIHNVKEIKYCPMCGRKLDE